MVSRNSHSQQVRLFRNEWLERLTIISPAGFAAVWCISLPMIAWVGWGSASVLSALGLVALGLGIWTLFEYCMHRYLFHWEPGVAVLDKFVYLMHGNHHAAPNDPLRNLMPPIVSFPIGGAVWLVLLALIGPAGSWAFLGFMTGYVIYDMTHYACHQWAMRGTLAFALKRHHMRHHHGKQDGNFAITALFWDRIFGSSITSLKPREEA